MNAAEDASIDRTMKKRPLDEVSNAHQVIDQDQLLRPAKLLKGIINVSHHHQYAIKQATYVASLPSPSTLI